MIYLATAYSYDPEEGYREAVKAVAHFMRQRIPVFSPIVHCHQAAKDYGLPMDTKWWLVVDKKYIDACDEVWVWKDWGGYWQDSRGVCAEVDYAKATGKPVRYIDSDTA